MISQNDHRCWELSCPVIEADKNHYDTEPEALDAVKEARENDPGCAPSVTQLPAPCWLVECDGDCEEVLDQEDNGYTIHRATRFEAAESALACNWVLARDELSAVTLLAYCPADVPPGCEPAPLPSELEAAGQMRLPGVTP